MSNKELFPATWLVNTLLDESFVISKRKELGQQEGDYTTLAKNALLLTLAASWADFAELAPLFDVQKHDVPVTAKAMDMLRAENDKIVARLYGIDDSEFAHLLKSFTGLAIKRPEYLALLRSI